jgi:hypothetical protein
MQLMATAAVAEDWGHDVVVIQDDIRFGRTVPPPTAPLTVYGTLSPSQDGLGHICPRAFTATAEMWQMLLTVLDGETKVCTAWRPIVDEHGQVLNVVSHPDVPRAQEPIRPRVSAS